MKYCKKCGRNHKHLKYCGWDVGKQKDHTANLERQLEESREFQKRIKHHCKAYEKSGDAWFNMNRIYKEVDQLKEKGEC